MARPITVFRASSGLNNKVDPNRLRFDPETGVQDLAVAYNIDHDRTGRPSRRRGFSSTDVAVAVHSLWCDKGPCLFVAGTSLCILAPDFSYKAVATVTAGAPMAYAQVSDRSYWMNGFEKGFVSNDENHAWVKGDYVGPSTKRQFSGPPIGDLLAYCAGIMYVIQGKVAWYSEPYAPNLYDLARNYLPLEHNITMLRFVRSGAFVGTEKNTWFFNGVDPKQMIPVKIADYGVIRGTDVSIDGEEIGEGNITGESAMWTSPAGICVGFPDGTMINVTRNRLSFPSSLRGSSLIVEDRYIGALEP